LVVTSDKVYENRNSGEPFTEADPLGGDDPYSASKAAAEAAVRAWRNTAAVGKWGLGTARAGNVIGGGDWGEDRLVPDIVRAGQAGQSVVLRHPQATRPWQHVLDVVAGYAAYAERLATDPAGAPPALNFGPPSDARAVTVSALVSRLQAEFSWTHGWVTDPSENPPEKTMLSVDARLAANTLGWRAGLSTDAALAWTAAWHHRHLRSEHMRAFSLQQIDQHASMATLQTLHAG
jgi:CDP-glucose 4,6-dehydratase